MSPPHVIPVISGGPVSDYENYEDKRDLDRYGKPTEPSGFGFGRLLILALIVAGIFWFYKYSQQSAGRKIEKDKRERIEESQTEKKGANRSRGDGDSTIRPKVRMEGDEKPRTEVLRFKKVGPFQQIPDIYPNVMSINTGPEGAVWITSKYGVTKFVEGSPGKALKIIDSQSYKQIFGVPMQAFSVSHVSATGELWVGSWHGEVFRYSQRRWTRLSDSETEPMGRITSIVTDGPVTYIAGRGLWFWMPGLGKILKPIEQFDGREVKALGLTGTGELIAAVRDEAFIRRDNTWTQLWKASDEDKGINNIHVRRSGNILIATHNGFAELELSGGELRRELEGSWVTGFAETPEGELWVGTWREGLYTETGGGWKKFGSTEGLPSDSLSSIVLDSANRRLWVGLYGKGALVGDKDEVKSRIASTHSDTQR